MEGRAPQGASLWQLLLVMGMVLLVLLLRMGMVQMLRRH
jgi:hypothetical protein